MNSDQQRKSMEIQMNETFHHHWFLMTLQKINKPQGIVIHTIDIQNVKETTNELEKERARNHNNARLAELGEMVGGIAHEINNPLAVINVRAQNALAFIAEGTMTPEKVKTSFESILKTSDRISQIIKSMKKAARNAENDPMEPIKVSQILDDTMTLCNHRIRLANIKIENRLHDQDIKIECRTSQITQVLINLIGNSIDSIEKKPEPWIRIETKDLGSNIQIRITDSGLGISEKIRDKIMNPFFTTKEVGKGTGMGLSISMGIIKSHGGSFTLDTSNSNTSFVIELPYLQKNPVQQTG
jgi:C4-dicarboxylate-specific signal transduction histidine kinase